MIKNIKDLAKEVEELAKEKGFTSIEPDSELISVKFNNEGISSLDFVLRKGNSFAGRCNVIVKNQSVEDQTVEQCGEISFK